ncbi:MAG: sigma-70 family RNA polymerase sigma factor [candidate division Zixibacteria bacterium]|nr:sigma-70 family RNA polymerase sigma factor [candidate division Zixibacteria bacterium]
MSSNRIVYQNWIADLGRDPGQRPDPDPFVAKDPIEIERREKICRAVAEALERLTDDEREFVERYYFMGRSYREISELSGRTPHRLEALHQRALKKLQKELTPLVKELYSLTPATNYDCPICASPDRNEIDRLIESRDPTSTWRPVMRQIREKYNIGIVTPQTLIGHEKYH